MFDKAGTPQESPIRLFQGGGTLKRPIPSFLRFEGTAGLRIIAVTVGNLLCILPGIQIISLGQVVPG